jgi:hypothetical protein
LTGCTPLVVEVTTASTPLVFAVVAGTPEEFLVRVNVTDAIMGFEALALS